MNSRERVLTAIARREPDRIPMNMWLAPALVEKLKNERDVEDYEDYWKNQELLRVQPDSVKASLYVRRASGGQSGRALVVVSNLSPAQQATAQLTLDLPRLGLCAPGVEAKDALSGEALRLDDNRLQCRLAPMRMRMVWVE